MLQNEDGFSICRQLRTSSSIPVIMLTGMADPTDRVVGLEIGADDYLTKPFDPRELLARVKAVLRRTVEKAEAPTRSDTRPVLRFAGWRLDVARRELRSTDNVLVLLSGGEFDLLLAFVEHPQRVLTRDQLIDYAHGSSHPAFDRSIDVQVSRIRYKLERDPKAPSLIRTVRNGGGLHFFIGRHPRMKALTWWQDTIARRFIVTEVLAVGLMTLIYCWCCSVPSVESGHRNPWTDRPCSTK